MFLLRINLPNLCPNMIHVDALDFSEWHSEEVISFFWKFSFLFLLMVFFNGAIFDNIPTKTLTLGKSMYMPASGASELRKCSHFHILKPQFFQYFVGILQILCRYTNDTLVGLHAPKKIPNVYRQNSKKHYGGGGGGQPLFDYPSDLLLYLYIFP